MSFKPTQRLCSRNDARLKGFRGPAITAVRRAVVGTSDLELPGILKQDIAAKRSDGSESKTKISRVTFGSGTSKIPKSELIALQSKWFKHSLTFGLS